MKYKIDLMSDVAYAHLFNNLNNLIKNANVSTDIYANHRYLEQLDYAAFALNNQKINLIDNEMFIQKCQLEDIEIKFPTNYFRVMKDYHDLAIKLI